MDSVTEVSTIRGPDIERNSEVTSTLDESIMGVGKQGSHLTIILDIARTTAKVQDQSAVAQTAKQTSELASFGGLTYFSLRLI